MRYLLQALSGVSLAGTILPAALYYTGSMELSATQNWMLVATAAWFVCTPFWMGRARPNDRS